MLLAVAEVVFEMVALIFEGVESLVLAGKGLARCNVCPFPAPPLQNRS